MILIAKRTIKLQDIKKLIPDSHKFKLPPKREHYEGTVIFTEGKPYKVTISETGVGSIQTDAGIFFIYAKGDGEVIPTEFFRIFTR